MMLETTEQFRLVSDGTLDTVFVCNVCGSEERFTFDAAGCGICEEIDAAECSHYDDFVEACLEELAADHECNL